MEQSKFVKMRRLGCMIVLRMRYPGPCSHTLDFAGSFDGLVVHRILVRQRPFKHIADDLHIAVRMGTEASALFDSIFIDNTQRSELNVLTIVVLAK